MCKPGLAKSNVRNCRPPVTLAIKVFHKGQVKIKFDDETPTFLRHRFKAMYWDNEVTGGFLHFKCLSCTRTGVCVRVIARLCVCTRWHPLLSVFCPRQCSVFCLFACVRLFHPVCRKKARDGGICWLPIVNAPHAAGLAYLMPEG